MAEAPKRSITDLPGVPVLREGWAYEVSATEMLRSFSASWQASVAVVDEVTGEVIAESHTYYGKLGSGRDIASLARDAAERAERDHLTELPPEITDYIGVHKVPRG